MEGGWRLCEVFVTEGWMLDKGRVRAGEEWSGVAD